MIEDYGSGGFVSVSYRTCMAMKARDSFHLRVLLCREIEADFDNSALRLKS
jgi:hypothetical protein